ncbi:MAG TPA: HlyD family efflux transporter periplasmic adaptor subunit [Kofleriaceae bacterium]|nr:HlyD family efflux transporter periplasmic adaptor subunit [Kofleriaceae bacterium]
MKKALVFIALLAAALVVALAVRLSQLRARGHGPPGGTGVIEGVDVNVTSRIATRIVKIDVREGDVVTQGQVVVELDCTDQAAALDQARAQLAAATSTLDASHASTSSVTHSASAASASASAAHAQLAALEAQERLAALELERTRRLVARDAVAASELDGAVARHDALVAQIAAQRAAEGASRDQAGALRDTGAASHSQSTAAERAVDVARAQVVRAELVVRECTLVAPRAGMVAVRALEPGEPVQPGSVVLAITDLAEARTRFYLPNAELAAAAPGRKVRVTADAYPGQTFEGSIDHVSPHAEFTPRNVQTRQDRDRLVYAVEVRIPNADLRLRAGMPVEVAIEGPTAMIGAR